jgi:hypothetical protein
MTSQIRKDEPMLRLLPHCWRCGEINPPDTHYYLDHLSKRFCTMRCRLAYKAEMQDWDEAPEFHV